MVEALESDVARASRAAMTAAERHAIEAFLNQPEAMVLPQGFIEAANKALQGIESVAVSVGALVEALREGACPAPPPTCARFTSFMQETLRGREEANTRLTLSEDRTLEASA